MKKQIIALALGLAFSANTFAGEHTDDEKKTELVGFGSGVVVGPLIAGPVGGAVAGIFGLLIADDVNDERRLKDTSAKLASREEQLVALHRDFERAKEQAQMQLVSFEKQVDTIPQELESSSQFRTASYAIEQHFKSQLDLLAENLKLSNNMRVTLSGYADRRGDSVYNQALSEQRVLSVKNYLLDKGVDSKQVLTNSYGESTPVDANQNLESDFFDRRVLVQVGEGDAIMTASN